MPIDHSFESSPSFRDLSHTGLLLLRQPVVRSLRRMQRLRRGLQALPETGLPVKTARLFRGGPLHDPTA